MTVKDRLYERHRERVEQGARRLVEQRQRMAEMFGEGGHQLSQIEQMEIYQELAEDPEGHRMSEVLGRRQRANKVGPDRVPRDFCDWDLAMNRKAQEGQP